MKLLLIDNYDSYTYNLFQLIAQVGGIEPEVVRNDAPARDAGAWDEFAAFVISPGPGHPARTRDFGIAAQIIASGRPVLGVCLGHQGIAHGHGAQVILGPTPMHGRITRVRHDGSGLFAGLPQDLAVVRYHSSIVARELPPCLEANAWAEDGVLMALRHRQWLQFGVQFHPESIATEGGARMIGNFLELVARARSSDQVAMASPGPGEPGEPRESRPTKRVRPRRTRTPIRFLALADPPAAEDVFVALYGSERHAFWLDSAVSSGPLSRFSFMGAPTAPGDQIARYRASEGRLDIERDGDRERTSTSIFDWLERELASGSRPGVDVPFPLQGGLVGYLGYELGAECVTRRQAWRARPSETPDAVWLACQRYLVFDHQTRTCYAVTSEDQEASADEWLADIRERIHRAPRAPRVIPNGAGPARFHLARSSARYLRDIRACMEEIRQGESYEVCLTNHLIGPALERPLDVYRSLRACNPAPYSGYLALGDLALLSCSPELFLRIDEHGQVMSKPIKGTSARTSDAAADVAARLALAASEKDRAENLMIVDLLRNDLGRVCEIGSVAVPHLMDVESFATVHQLVSTVTGTLRADRSAIECVRAAFPGGSMTGAPKERTMAIIDALEAGPRGVYSGCFGYLSHHGAADLAMTIRTAVATAGETRIGVGGAVVALSDPDAEVAEMVLKGRALMAGIAAATTGDGRYVLHDGADVGGALEDPHQVRELDRLGREVVDPGPYQ